MSQGISLSEMELFLMVARAKSFTRAAEANDMPISTLSRRISELEKKLGLRLFNRTTRRFEITEDGMHYLFHAQTLVEHASAIHDDLIARNGKPSGSLRISLPESVAVQQAVPWFAEFLDRYPAVTLDINTAPDHVNQVADNFDICIYDRAIPSSSLTIRQFASFPRTLCASPDYLAKSGTPASPKDLERHKCICAGNDRMTQHRWLLTRGSEAVSVNVAGPVTTASLVLAPEFARSGIGIASVILDFFEDDVRAGRLIPVLPDWQPEPLLLAAIISHRVIPARVRAFLDFFGDKVRQLQVTHTRSS